MSRADECVVGNPAAAHVAVLNGDSHAEMLRNAVWRAFDPKAWSIHIFARSGCGWAGAANGTVSAATLRAPPGRGARGGSARFSPTCSC